MDADIATAVDLLASDDSQPAVIVNKVEYRLKHMVLCSIPSFGRPSLLNVYGCCHDVDMCALCLAFPRFCAWAPPFAAMTWVIATITSQDPPLRDFVFFPDTQQQQ
jgi:hypothetical protein